MLLPHGWPLSPSGIFYAAFHAAAENRYAIHYPPTCCHRHASATFLPPLRSVSSYL